LPDSASTAEGVSLGQLPGAPDRLRISIKFPDDKNAQRLKTDTSSNGDLLIYRTAKGNGDIKVNLGAVLIRSGILRIRRPAAADDRELFEKSLRESVLTVTFDNGGEFRLQFRKPDDVDFHLA